MKTILIIIILFSSISCLGQDVISPNGYEVLDDKTGDLDNDGIAERVIVYNTTDTTGDGIVREIQVLKNDNNNWEIWKKSRTAVLKSMEGGMMGDPFEEIEIKDGILIISFSGGSSWKWFYQDKYRFQNNEFELIGYSNIYGKLCEYWINIDFNISTGKIIYKKEFEKCENQVQKIYKTENEIFYKKGISINLNNRNTEEIKIVSPKYKHEFYL